MRRVLTRQFQGDVAALNPGDSGFGLAELYSKQAGRLGGLLSPELMAGMEPAKAKMLQSEVAAAVRLLHAQSDRVLTQAARAETDARGDEISTINVGRTRQAMAEVLRQNPGSRGYLSRAERAKLRADAEAAWPAIAPTAAGPNFTGYGMKDVRARLPVTAARAPLPPWMTKSFFEGSEEPEKPKQSPMAKAWQQGFTPEGFALHLVKVAGWAAAVTTLYKSFEMLEYSMHRVIDVGGQMARLQMTYHGVGGSVQALTNDVLGLAAANGRATDEAMESAAAWGRLGLTRTQINEAVRVSAVAANVADMHMSETSKQLAGMMRIYHLPVGALGGELGKMVDISQRNNVTLEDLFHGVDAAGPLARSMGMGLPELSGLISGMVGKTEQSGTVVGNTLKYVLQQFSRQPIQDMLRGYGVESTTQAGDLKAAPQLLRELFVRYQGLSGTERQSMTTQLAGRFHGTRFVGMMDSYLDSQKQAIDSQLNLNAAQTANAAILDTLQNKLAGLKSEWDRFVFTQANAPSGLLGGFSPMQLLSSGAGRLTGMMQAMDENHESVLGRGALSAGILGGYTVGHYALRSSMDRTVGGVLTKGSENLISSLMKRYLPATLTRLISGEGLAGTGGRPGRSRMVRLTRR